MQEVKRRILDTPCRVYGAFNERPGILARTIAPHYTPLFACCRVVGWSAHVIEQKKNRLFLPNSLYGGPENLAFIPADKRKPQ